MDPIILSLLFMAGSKISSALIQQQFQSAENKKLRNEARFLSEVTRQDQLKENQRQNQLNEQSVGLTSKKLSFQNVMTNNYITDKNKEKQSLLNTSTQNRISGVASNLGFTPQDQSLKNRILGRV